MLAFLWVKSPSQDDPAQTTDDPEQATGVKTLEKYDPPGE
jgi:hypothetical protein